MPPHCQVMTAAQALTLTGHDCRIDEYTAGAATNAARSGEPLPQLLGNLQKLVSSLQGFLSI